MYAGYNTAEQREVAVKLEHRRSTMRDLAQQAEMLQEVGPGATPDVIHYGSAGDYFAMVTEPFGPSLADLQAYCGGRLSLGVVLVIARKLLAALEEVHTKGYLHGDLNRHSVFLGPPRSPERICLLDLFGATDSFRHLKPNEQRASRYAHSWQCHMAGGPGHLTPGSDVEAVGYLLLELLHARLPWHACTESQNLPALVRSSDAGELAVHLPPVFAEVIESGRACRKGGAVGYAALLERIDQTARECGCKEGGETLLGWTMQHGDPFSGGSSVAFPGSPLTVPRFSMPQTPGGSQVIRALLPDGSVKSVSVSPVETAAMVIEKLAEKLDLGEPAVLALYVSKKSPDGVGEKPGRVIRPAMPVLATVLATLQQEQGSSDSVHLRQRFFSREQVDCSKLSEGHIRLLFLQLASAARRRHHFHREQPEHAVKLAAMHLFHECGDDLEIEVRESPTLAG